MGDTSLEELLRSARISKGLTQQQVADAVHVSREAYVKMENGARGVASDMVMPLCRFLGISAMAALSAVSGMAGRPAEIHIDGGGDDPVFGFPDNGVTYLFEPDEWELHCEMARFAGVDPECPTALALSHDVISMHRTVRARGTLRKYLKKDGTENGYET